VDSADAVIVGGGLIGCAAAYYLAARGVRSILVERRGLATEASGANAGMVGESTGIPGRTLTHAKKSLDLLASDAEALGRPVEFVRRGRIVLAATDAEWPGVEEFAATRRAEGIAVDLLAGDDLHRLEPALAPGFRGAAFVPGDGHVNPFLLTHAYATAARTRGVDVRVGTEAIRIEVLDDRVSAVLTPSGPISCAAVIVAAGAWTAPLLAPLGIHIPVRPGRGQMLVTEALPAITPRVLKGPEIGIRQDVRGHVLIGSAVEDTGYDRGVTLPMLSRFSRLAAALIPSLGEARVIRTWAGLRPMTPDGLAIIDAVPDVRGLYLAAGHSRTGVTYAPVTAWLTAQLVTDGRTELPLDPFKLQRFSIPVPAPAAGAD